MGRIYDAANIAIECEMPLAGEGFEVGNVRANGDQSYAELPVSDAGGVRYLLTVKRITEGEAIGPRDTSDPAAPPRSGIPDQSWEAIWNAVAALSEPVTGRERDVRVDRFRAAVEAACQDTRGDSR